MNFLQEVNYMDNKLDVLILNAFFGAGHYTVSKAIKEQALSIDDTLNIELLDPFNYANPKLDKYIYKFYNFITKEQPKIYNYFYNLKSNKPQNYQDDFVYMMTLQKVSKYILESRPKVIISTFPTCSGIVSKFKEKYDSKIPLITCITDVVDSWEWIHPNTDTYFVPTQEIKKKLISKGVSSDIIKVTGIPVRRSFLDLHNNNQKNHVEEMKNILIMGGARGAFDIIDLDFLYWLDTQKNVDIKIVTGTNKKLYEYLTVKHNFKNIKILGFVENVAELMSQTHLLITKPGGVTIFEAINCETPMIIKRPKIGQEMANADFIEKYGIGIIKDHTLDIKSCLEDLISSDYKVVNMKKKITNLKTEMDTKNIGNYVMEYIQKH